MSGFVRISVALALGLVSGGVQAASVRQMQGARRVLIVAAPSATDAGLAAQRRALDAWSRDAADRDVSRVEIVGDRVAGADDRAAELRRRYRLPPASFALVLVGKDGHEAYRSPRPVSAATLEATIDAMPMRRAGQR